MATFSISVPDAAVTRIQAAFSDNGQPASLATVQAAIKSFIKSRVIAYETNLINKQAINDMTAKEKEIIGEVW